MYRMLQFAYWKLCKSCWVSMAECDYALSCRSRTPCLARFHLMATCEHNQFCTVSCCMDCCALLHHIYKQNALLIPNYCSLSPFQWTSQSRTLLITEKWVVSIPCSCVLLRGHDDEPVSCLSWQCA